MDIFKIASYVGYLHCDSAVKVAFPVVQLVFVVVQVKKPITKKLRNLLKSLSLRKYLYNCAINLQTYFLWIHAKDCVQIQRNITR